MSFLIRKDKIQIMNKKIFVLITSLFLVTQSLISPVKIVATELRCNPSGGKADSGIETAIGCISVLDSPDVFLGAILKWAVGIGGGLAFILIVYAGFMIMSATGSPDRLKAGQELLTSALSGLILLVFSIFILKFIGVDILGLGAFGFGK